MWTLGAAEAPRALVADRRGALGFRPLAVAALQLAHRLVARLAEEGAPSPVTLSAEKYLRRCFWYKVSDAPSERLCSVRKTVFYYEVPDTLSLPP